ncbi:MAG: hypothetical protein WBM00_07335 [Solirubrobacterales bacterium]
MIRQARTYLTGAVSATALIAAAVVAFVLLVSLQALESWPLANPVDGAGKTKNASRSHPAAGAGGIGTAATVHVSQGAQPHGASGSGSGAGLDANTKSGSAPGGGEGPNSPSTSDGNPAPSAGNSGPAGSAGSSASEAAGGSPPHGSGGGREPLLPGTVGSITNDAIPTVQGTVEESGVTKATEEVAGGAGGLVPETHGAVGQVTETVDGVLGAGK